MIDKIIDITAVLGAALGLSAVVVESQTLMLIALGLLSGVAVVRLSQVVR